MIQFLGIKTDEKGWKHFAWIATLNGIDIDYKTGLGHSKSPYTLDGAGGIKSNMFGKPKPMSGHLLISVDKDQARDFLSVFNMSRTLWNAERLDYIYVKIPRVRDILWSLYMDASGAQESFDDWCSNYGYETDSRRTLETYLACQESGHKLRKIMKSKNYLERIQAWEL